MESLLSKDKLQREQFTKSMATYYEQVRVCETCAGIYGCLDWARDVLGQGDAYGAGLEGLGAAHPQTKSKRIRTKLSATADIGGLESQAETGQVLQHSQSVSALPSYATATSASLASQSVMSHQTASAVRDDRAKRNVNGRVSDDKQQAHKSWKDHLPSSRSAGASAPVNLVNGNQFVKLDDYLRGGSDALATRKALDQEKLSVSLGRGARGGGDSSLILGDNLYHGTVLLACDNSDHVEDIKSVLEEAHFAVHVVRDGRQAVNDFVLKENGFDCVLVQRDLPLNDAFKVTEGIREFEKLLRKKAAAFAAAAGRGIQPPTRRHPVVCVTASTLPADLKAYMAADMDGCVSLPINAASLLSTVRASIPHHLAIVSSKASMEVDLATKTEAQVYRLGSLGELEGSSDSSTMAAKTLPISSSSSDDIAFNGIVQIDADTRVPFIVMDASRTAKVLVNPVRPFFNLVVCHDLFDTAERMKIFLRPMVQRYLGMQVLLWNYPGQAFTEWREEQLLNNEYLATCLNEVLGQVGEKGTRDFDTSRPFYVLGYGNGASVASFYASHYRVPNLRGLINVNGWSFLDSYLAGIMHDCVNIFQCSPPSRPDLPVYFFSRFIFSKDYLAKVSVPLALNIYTAVHNSISIKGRLSLCKGVLQLVDVRPLLKEIDCPVICIHSTQDALARPMHAEPFATYRGGEVRSIHKVLQNAQKTCVIWMKGGHEVFQENKKQTQLIIEQILTGFHETHDVSFPAGATLDPTTATEGVMISSLPWENSRTAEKTVEDKFIDNVIGSMNKLSRSSMDLGLTSTSFNAELSTSNVTKMMTTTTAAQSSTAKGMPVSLSMTSSPDAWNKFSEGLADSQVLSKSVDTTKGPRKGPGEDGFSRVIDPTSTSFERQESVHRAAGSKQNVHEYPEVKEFMSWRLKRNKKRLQRLQGAARVIQGAFRAYIARRFVHGIRRLKAALFIQRVFRGWRGRFAFQKRARRIWAAQIIQRSWRGFVGRKWYFLTRLRIVAACNIQRTYRGRLARVFVNRLKRMRFLAASLIQAMGRRYIARKDAWRRRQYRNCATSIQRIFRGYLGNKRAIAERNKYIFSRSQSQGIEFGRQMLLEHKLHATKLQSDVTLLTQEKVGAEEQIEALLEEISSFEEGVRTLEKEMHQLSKVESEAAAFMDEDSKFELREQKIKLDREFGEMLSKIGTRKDMLNDLEHKLSTVDKSRQSKEEELRMLERKLVVLLEEQQNELNAIKRKQDVRGAMLAASHEELMKVTGGEGSASSDRQISTRNGGGGGGSGSGPSLQEKKQAAQLMQSTETLMKFGFMSMSMTYFSSLNMIKALRTVSAQDTVMAALADVQTQRAVGFGGNDSGGGSISSESKANFLPDLRPGQLSGQQVLKVSAWSVDDVAKWLQTLSLVQYSEAFIDSAVDGEFLYDLNDDDLKNTLGIEHRLHRKKILNCVHRLKLAEAQRDNRLNELLRDGGSLDAPVCQWIVLCLFDCFTRSLSLFLPGPRTRRRPTKRIQQSVCERRGIWRRRR
jgi:CheY-like chemotaxis protein/predicted  nucleic acid-binding Zn-ribbon protein